MKKRVLLSWSSGKDSAWSLHTLRRDPQVEVVGLLTTFNEAADRVAMHAVRRELVEAQAAALDLPLWPVMLPWPSSNAVYLQRMSEAIEKARAADVTHVAFGDLFLEDIRDYRIQQMKDTGIEPLFPIWSRPDATTALAHEIQASGLKAVLTCVDPKQIPATLIGRFYDPSLLGDLPEGADLCGERGEFHTFCFDGPMFRSPLAIELGEVVEREGFVYMDVRLVD